MPEIVPADTTLEAFHVQFAILRRMQPSRRLELACQLSDFVRGNCAAGVRSRHPEYSEKQVHLAVIRLTLGDKLFREVYPGVSIQL